MSIESVRARNDALRAEGKLPGALGTATAGARLPLPALAQCVHGGTDADIIERCSGCAAGSRHVRECAVHGTCTHELVSPAVMDCARCRRENLGYEPERK